MTARPVDVERVKACVEGLRAVGWNWQQEDACLEIISVVEALLAERDRQFDALKRIGVAHPRRCPLFGHTDGSEDPRRRRLDCSDEQCQNPGCVRYIRCAHSWHEVDEALTAAGVPNE